MADCELDGSEMDACLKSIYKVQCQNPEMFKSSRYKVQMKGQQDQSRVDNHFLKYEGPDQATVELLARHQADWKYHPLRFWSRPASSQSTPLDYQAQLVECYLRAKSDDA